MTASSPYSDPTPDIDEFLASIEGEFQRKRATRPRLRWLLAFGAVAGLALVVAGLQVHVAVSVAGWLLALAALVALVEAARTGLEIWLRRTWRKVFPPRPGRFYSPPTQTR